ncbi:MAG: PRC-barrel domain-containing protein [Solirubrobacterales bacterium]
MIAAELRGGNKPSLNEALGWIGSRVDDIYGAAVGRLEDVWIDPGTGAPRWLLVKEGRFGGRSTLVPFSDATAGAGHVWIPYERDVVREAPQIEPGVPLTQQVEATLRNHYAANATAAVSHGTRTARAEPRQPRSDEQATPRATVRLAAAEAPEGDRVPPPRLPQRPPPPVNVPAPEQEPEPGYGAAPQQPYPPQQQQYQQQQQQPYPPPPPQPYPQQQPEPEPRSYPPYGHQPPPAAYPYQPPPADPIAAVSDLPAGHMIEIELTGNLTISGELRHVRIVPPGEAPGHRG